MPSAKGAPTPGTLLQVRHPRSAQQSEGTGALQPQQLCPCKPRARAGTQRTQALPELPSEAPEHTGYPQDSPLSSGWLTQLVPLLPRQSGTKETPLQTAHCRQRPTARELIYSPCGSPHPRAPGSKHILLKPEKIVLWGTSLSHQCGTKSFRKDTETPPRRGRGLDEALREWHLPVLPITPGHPLLDPPIHCPCLHFGRPPLGAPTGGCLQAFCCLAAPQHLLHTERLRGWALQVLRQFQQQHLCLGLPPALPGCLRGRHGPIL